LCFIITVGFVFYLETKEIFDAADDRAHILKNISNIETVLYSISILEEGQRSFLITNDEDYLASFEPLSKKIEKNLTDLKFRMQNDLNGVNNLESLAEARYESLLKGIEYKKKGKMDLVQNQLKVGKEYMQQLRDIIAEMLTRQNNLYNLIEDNLAGTIKTALLTIIAGALIICTVFLSIFFTLKREIAERKKAEEKIINEKEFSVRLLNSSLDGIIAFDRNYSFTLWNRGMENLTGIPEKEVLNKNVFQTFPVLKSIGEDKNIHHTLAGEHVIVKDKFFTLPETKKKGYLEAYYSPVVAANKQITGGLIIIRDTTQKKLMMEELQSAKRELEKRVEERTSALAEANGQLMLEIMEKNKAHERIQESLEEKIVLIKEIHHRVKNNLQVISSLLNLQSAYIKNAEARELFGESRNKIRSMALVYEKLYQSKNLNEIKYKDYIYSLTGELSQLYKIDSGRITITYGIDDISIKIDPAILCGLIINELVSNSLKHAFPGEKKGEIFIGFRKNGNNYFMTIKDDGIGFPQNYEWVQTNKLGLQLVHSLSEQLHGSLKINYRNSTEFNISFPA
jgi:PAS domain S-box-containing protein